MSEDSDSEPRVQRKRKVRSLEDIPSSSSSTESFGTNRRQRGARVQIADEESDSDSGSSIELQPRKKKVPRVTSDVDSDSSDSVIVKKSRGPARLVSESESEGFGSSSSEWETDSDHEKPTGGDVDSDSSDGQSDKCPICLVSLRKQIVGTPETCNHLFCAECIQEWSKNMNTCPVDRQEYKLILIRKRINGKVVKSVPVEPPTPQDDTGGELIEDETHCQVCGSSDREDRMLLCDGCDMGFHLECLTPPLEQVPRESWFCDSCRSRSPILDLVSLQVYLGADEENTSTRRIQSSRIIPRTRRTERVRRRVQTSRITRNQSVSSTTQRRTTKKKRKKPRYRTVYQIDNATGETIAVKKRVKRKKKKKKKSRRDLEQNSSTPRGRLATQLGMCALRSKSQHVPEVRVQNSGNNITNQRYQAGIPTLHLFGHRDSAFYSPSEDDDDNEREDGIAGSGVLIRRFPNRSDVAALRRASRVKNISIPNPVSSSSDILGSILESQTKLYSKNTICSVDKDGNFKIENRNKIEFNNYHSHLRQQPGSYSNNTSTNDSVPSSSSRGDDYSRNNSNNNSPDQSNSAPTSTVEHTSQGGNMGDDPQEYVQQSDRFEDSNDRKAKKSDEISESNTPRSETPCSESEIDIYGDIETVSTSNKLDEGECKPSSSPQAVVQNQNNGSDDENNDSEPDMVIDTEKANVESEENTKEETAVTSTVDSNNEIVSNANSITSVAHSTSEFESERVQSSNYDKNEGQEYIDKDDDDSEDGCPNFSIYSKESITLAKNTDVGLASISEAGQETEVSSSPALNRETRVQETGTLPSKLNSISVLYSDSEDETIVKKDLGNSFAIADIRNMTEDISEEEERSYTPCLDERVPVTGGLEGLDTEMISDEDRNDFDESHELKTASDGDALEINAKESELDFTRPEDYEEGEIVDKNKNKKEEEQKTACKEKSEEPVKKISKKKDDDSGKSNKENEGQNKESAFKKLSKSNKERNYRDKDKERDRSKSRDRKEKSDKDSKRERKREKRKEIQRYDVRALIAEKPRRVKDKFGRDIRRSASRSRSHTPRRSLSRNRRSKSREWKKKRGRRSLSRSRSRSPERKRSRSKKRNRRSTSRDRSRKQKSLDRSKTKKKRSRSRSRSFTPKRRKEWSGRREWTPSLSRSVTPEPRHLTPSWTPPRLLDNNSVKPHNLTVILTNDAGKKKKDKRKKNEKKAKETEKTRKRKRGDKNTPPSKEVFASGDNILVSVSFNKENETRDVSTKKKREFIEEQPNKKTKKDKRPKARPKKNRDLSGIKPVAIIDLERSPFKELTPSPKDIIVLSDSDNEPNSQKGICDSSEQVPDRLSNYSTGPKTPPEPQIKFTLASKQPQMRAITNPLHEPDDIEPENDNQDVDTHKGPNTPPEPPNSPPSSPDAYDPFEPTKSRSPTPEVMDNALQSNSAINIDDNHDDSIMETRSSLGEINEKSSTSLSQPTEVLKSLTPPLADVQPADSQSSVHATPESNLGKSPERMPVSVQSTPVQAAPPAPTPTVITSTPSSSSVTPSNRINILNATIITPPHVPSSLPQRTSLPNVTIKVSPAKPPQNKSNSGGKGTRKASSNRNQNGNDTNDSNVIFDSPYSPGSSDYEDLFEPPVEAPTAKSTTKAPSKPTTKSPTKIQNAFDALFGSPFNKIKPKTDKTSKFNKKPATGGKTSKGTKQVGVKLDEDNLKILDELPNSAVEMQVKDKFLKKLNRQERVVEEVKLVLKPHYNKKHVNKEEYKDILRRAVPKICHNKSGEINPTKIKSLIEAYVKKVRHSKKVTSSSSVNTQKA